jgi:cyclopropane fatty-acyl-phospholipid synthase-like methyltransferase
MSRLVVWLWVAGIVLAVAFRVVVARKARRRLLPPSPSILDVGCGGGAQTLTLAALSSGTAIAVDSYPVFIEELRERVAARGLSGGYARSRKYRRTCVRSGPRRTQR